MNKGHLDYETRSALDIKRVGFWKYVLHPSTEIIAATWKEPGFRQTLTREQLRDGWCPIPPRALEEFIISAHNAPFEYAVTEIIGVRRLGWPAALRAASRWRCTMAKAAACGLPLDLDTLGRVLQIKTPKDLEGKKVMLQLSRPLNDDVDNPIFDEDATKYERLYSYNSVDVDAEDEVDILLPDLSPDEQKVWELDLAINRRGIALDLEFARRAHALAAPLVDTLNRQLHAITCSALFCDGLKGCDGVDAASRVDAMKRYIFRRWGVAAPALDKENVTILLEDPTLPMAMREVLAIRRQVAKKNSVAKYATALECAADDGRARGLLQYHGAHTGRWAGRLLQPTNIPKGFKEKAQAVAVTDIMTLTGDAFVAKYGQKSMDTISDATRGVMVAGPGKVFICADFNAIEARVLFWEAGEEGALNGYRRGESPYVDMARYIYGNPKIVKPTEADKTFETEYDIGKRTILGCGYGMGADTFKANIFSETAKVGRPVTISLELSKRAVKAYREKYPWVKNLWYDVERAAINAVRNPGMVFTTCGGRVLWSMSNDRRFLVVKLPSGRFLRYWKPSIGRGKTPWGEEKEELRFMGFAENKALGFVLLKTYGGALVENITQAIARDLMVAGMFNVEAAGFDPLLNVYDEVLSEMRDRSDVEYAKVLSEYVALLTKTPAWALGCPVSAEGWIGRRYHK